MKEAITSARRKLTQLANPDLYRIDIDQAARELELESEARRMAKTGLPRPDDTALSAPEAKAVQRVEKARREFVQWASVRVSAINEDLRGNDVAALVNDALAADNTFERKSASVISRQEHLLSELAENAAVRERELDDFRARHRLSRPATYPEGSATFARYAILLALIVIEGIANAYFFSQGLESGLIGGFLAAGLFAAVNLVTAFVLGKYAVPLVFHGNPLLKALGVAGAAFAVVAMITVGLTIAHFRDALTADAVEPARIAWAALQASPFGLRDIMSWLLFAISVLFAVFALFDGLSSDDRYPGYGPVARRARQARDDYLSEMQAIRGQLESLKDEALDLLEDNLQRVRALTTESATLLREKRWLRTQLETALLDAENCLYTLLKIFRDANAMHRGALARPAYFDARPALSKLVVPDFGSDDDRGALDAQERLAAQLAAEADGVRAAIEATFSAHAERLKPADRRLATVLPLHADRAASHAKK